MDRAFQSPDLPGIWEKHGNGDRQREMFDRRIKPVSMVEKIGTLNGN